MALYKILRDPEWERLRRGEDPEVAVDLRDGFVHLSDATQVEETARRHFAGEDGLWLLRLRDDLGPALRREPSRGGAPFPHLHRPLLAADVAEAVPLPLEEGGHRFPSLA